MEMNNAVLVYSKSVSNNSKTEPELSQLVKDMFSFVYGQLVFSFQTHKQSPQRL